MGVAFLMMSIHPLVVLLFIQYIINLSGNAVFC